MVALVMMLSMLQMGSVFAAPFAVQATDAEAAAHTCCPAGGHSHGMCPMHAQAAAAGAPASGPTMCACHHASAQFLASTVAILPAPSAGASSVSLEPAAMPRTDRLIARVSIPDPPPPRR